MPLEPVTLTTSILAAGAEMVGPAFPILANAIGSALPLWVHGGNINITGVTSGNIGVGSVQGKVFLAPNIPLMYGIAQSSGLLGPTAFPLIKAITLGVATAVSSTLFYSGASPLVSFGIDVSILTPLNPATLTGLLQASGIVNPFLIAALSAGIPAFLQTAVCTGVVVGVITNPAIGAGVSFSQPI